MINIEAIARVCHEANRAYCLALGDTSQLPWDDAPDWARKSAIKGVEFHLENPHAKPSASHESWLEEKRATGWTYGPVKDADLKTHPCFIPFEGLPIQQQAKDVLFKSVVDSLRGLRSEIQVRDDRELEVIENKSLRRDIDAEIQRVKSLPASRERSLAITKLQEAVMWLGMDLKRLNEPNPYPNSKDPSNTRIEPTADNLKL